MSTKPATAHASVADPKQSPLGRIFRAFSYRDYRLLWFGAFTSSSGTWLQQTAQSWLLFQLTGQAFFLGLDSFLSTAPILLFSLIGGVIADRFDRRRILLVSQWLQLIFAFTLAGLTAFGVSSRLLVMSMLTLSFLTGCAQAFGGPAYQALVPMLVERRDLANAIALNSIQFNLARVIGPAIGSIPFALISSMMAAAAVSFGINGLSFVAVMIALISLRVRSIPRPASAEPSHWRSDLGLGLKFVLHNEALRSLTLLSFACAFFGTQLTTFLAVFAERIYHTGASGYSVLLSTTGAGAVVGALIVAGLGDIRHKGYAALISQVVFGVIVVCFSLLPWIELGYPLVFLAGVAMMMVFAFTNSLVQLIVSDEMRGRVMSIYMVAFRGGMPLGALVTGWLAQYFQITVVLAAGGALLALLGVGFLLSPSRVKEH
ncbi:MAG: MFS transporter [Blastocatellales bacterium]|nr:MFS transporter [Blastocatellales bacterium]